MNFFGTADEPTVNVSDESEVSERFEIVGKEGETFTTIPPWVSLRDYRNFSQIAKVYIIKSNVLSELLEPKRDLEREIFEDIGEFVEEVKFGVSYVSEGIKERFFGVTDCFVENGISVLAKMHS